MRYLEFCEGNISPGSFALGWAFHRLPKPPFCWFAQVMGREQAITCASCQGLRHDFESTRKAINWNLNFLKSSSLVFRFYFSLVNCKLKFDHTLKIQLDLSDLVLFMIALLKFTFNGRWKKLLHSHYFSLKTVIF